jgi:nucleotide-binding universal stress UspA family protein
VKSILNSARKHEDKYDWAGAIESYRKALGSESERDFSSVGEIHERLGYALYRAAMQSGSTSEFRDKMHQAIAHCDKAGKLYENLGEPMKTPRMLRCSALVMLASYWLAQEAPEKKKLLDGCWRLTKESVDAFKEAGDHGQYGLTYNQLSTCSDFGCFLEWDYQTRKKTLKEAVDRGEHAIVFLTELKDLHELARAYAKTANSLSLYGTSFLELDEQEKHIQKAAGYWQKAKELSKEKAMLELLSFAAGLSLYLVAGTDLALENFEEALEYGRKTKDRLIIGYALDSLAYHTYWRVHATENPDEREKLAKRALQLAQDASHQYSLASFMSPRDGVLWAEAPYAEHYWQLASFETDPTKRRDLLRKAHGTLPELLARAERSGYPDVIFYAHHVSSKILTTLAETETSSEEQKTFLEKSLEHRNETITIVDRIAPSDYWNRGVMQKYLADIKSRLGSLDEEDREARKSALQEAVLDLEKSLKLCSQGLELLEKTASLSQLERLGSWQYEHGDLLVRLYKLTNDTSDLRKAETAFKDATRSFQKLNLKSREAECCWKTALVHDALSMYFEAAHDFILASNNYGNAAEKIPQLEEFYKEHALYMQAWHEIEKARHHHGRQEYGSAREHFEQAAKLHRSLKHWSYLASNYKALAEACHAEELSRNEQTEEAIKTFRQADGLFSETRESLQMKLGNLEDTNEKQMAVDMTKAIDRRHEYCMARIALEEAKILDKRGDHYSSSEKYRSAAETFEKLSQTVESEQERREFGLLVNISRAWQKMTLAEAEASPALYLEASQFFERVKELSLNEKAKMLALGHSRFCKALEVGTKFADTRDTVMHANTLQSLESAAGYYLRAGFQQASEYAKATELLFDAYVLMDNAKKENDPDKKAKLYIIAEKILQRSADSYVKAEHQEKKEQVLALLAKVSDERELAMSIAEVLQASPVVSATTALPTPTPYREEAVGLERFEHADIQANIIVNQKELKVGENLAFGIELVNSGKGSALLIKIERVIPECFELREKPENYRVEDNSLNMKGKRLEPLKTEEIRLILTPRAQGTFLLKPKISYLDENGKYRSHELETISITVKELGIRGWIKGER